jgi:UDP:flavonoid glycosyltransferase YjiC (YdhE family)
MNSISEAIHFGVPLVCIPIDFDQPGVAYRVSDELGFGIRLNKETCNADIIKEAINEILEDISYHERIVRFSRISRRYNGSSDSAKLVNDFITKKLMEY